MSLALAEAAGRYGHVMFPSNLHPPAVQLAQYLLEKGPGKGWAQRVFYSGNHDFLLQCLFAIRPIVTTDDPVFFSLIDDGSTGMEVAIKMAMRLWDTRAKKGLIKSYQDSSDSDDSEDLVEDNMKKLVVLTQRDCYHG